MGGQASLHLGLHQEEIARRGWALSAADAIGQLKKPDFVFVDLRETGEREKHGVMPGATHLPYSDLVANIAPGGKLRQLAESSGKRILFFCAFGERSAMAVQAAQDAGFISTLHIEGGVGAWKKADGPLQH